MEKKGLWKIEYFVDTGVSLICFIFFFFFFYQILLFFELEVESEAI